MTNNFDERVEQLGPAERIIQTLTSFTDHMVHNRPGYVSDQLGSAIGKSWNQAAWKKENGQRILYRLVGKKRVRLGILDKNNKVESGARSIEYRKAGIFPEVAEYLYRQVAAVWKMDNDFVAHWASWSFMQNHRDMKVILAAFMLVQDRKGGPVTANDEILFYDENFRDIGEAMCLIRQTHDINPKLLLRIGDVLNLPGVADINRELGFGNSTRNPARGRYYRVVTKWLRYREENLPMLTGLVKAGYRTTVMRLARRVGYKPLSKKFFEVLRWKQIQKDDGRRCIAIGEEVKKAETWDGLSEEEICEIIVKSGYDWKRIKGMLPVDVGVTSAILAASVESGCMSDKDLVILTPTLEEFGLLDVEQIKCLWSNAVKNAEDRRAANIAKNVKSKKIKEKLKDAADEATNKVLKEATRNLRIYCMVDISGSMTTALTRAKKYLERLLVGFPLEQLHVSVFNTMGKEIKIKSSKAAAVKHAFRGYAAGGGTCYAAGVYALVRHLPKDDEDVLMIFVGDELDHSTNALVDVIRVSKINPVAFGLLKIKSAGYGYRYNIVSDTAAILGIPCIEIDEDMFKSDDPYAIPRILRNLIANTPVGVKHATVKRKQLVREILETPLLQKPAWA